MLRIAKITGVGVVLGLLATACGSDGGTPTAPASEQTKEVKVELFSWWVNPGEAEALQALIDLNKSQHAKERIYNAAEDSGTDAKQVLQDRLAADDPPDLFQQNAHDMRAFLAANPGKIEPLDDLFAAQGLNDVVVPEVLDDVSVGGHVYSMPVNIHRENSLFYNKEIFSANKLKPPTTVEEFFTVCDTLKAKGITPVATSYQGWIQRIMFNSLAMGRMGGREFVDEWTGKKAMDQAALGAAIDDLARVLDDYSNADAGDADFGWTNAAQAVFDGKAAMFFHGDWAKGYFVQLGWTPNVDFGVVGAPGAADTFWYGVDVFALPTGAKQPAGARDFLTTVASVEGQVDFNSIKGSSPMRLDVPGSSLDDMGREVLLDLNDAAVRSLVSNLSAWDTALGDYATSRDKDALMQVYADNPPE